MQNSLENIRGEVVFYWRCSLWMCNYITIELQQGCFLGILVKFVRTSISQKISGWLILYKQVVDISGICRSSHPKCSIKKGVLKNFAKFTGKHRAQTCNYIKKETLAQVRSCEFCEFFKITYSILKIIYERLLLVMKN